MIFGPSLKVYHRKIPEEATRQERRRGCVEEAGQAYSGRSTDGDGRNVEDYTWCRWEHEGAHGWYAKRVSIDTGCPDGLYHQMAKKRNVCHFQSYHKSFLKPHSSPQESKCDETSTVGSLPRIPLQITIFLVTLTTREQLLGFSKVASIKNGDRLLHSCGCMENVRSALLPTV